MDGRQLISVSQAPVAQSGGDPRIGVMLCGRYQVRRVVADGGMGRVYEALDVQSQRNVALKVLHPEVTNDKVALERFKREFEVSQLLTHKHVVEVYDFQPTGDGSYVLAMEFLYGEELRSTLKREKTLPPSRVIRMLAQLAAGLGDAHARRLVHRDLKPDNIFLCQTSDGDNAKILDFGSVKDKADNAKKLTVMGTTIGSPYYMAPEQAQGLETLDHRADVWALAAIVYECLTGKVPFNGPTGPSILLEILTKTPLAVTQAAAGGRYPVPPLVDRVLSRGFQKSPALRTESVAALADQLGQAYGLEGNHVDWLTQPEAELQRIIEAKLPQLMATPLPAEPGEAMDGFFGDGVGLGALAPVVDDGPLDFAPGVPRGMPKWLIPAVIVGMVMMVLLAVVLVFVM